MNARYLAPVLLMVVPGVLAAQAAGTPAKAHICLAPSSVETASGTAAQAMQAVRETFSSFLTGPTLEVAPLQSRLPSQAKAEAKAANCPFVLLTTLMQVHKGGGGPNLFGRAGGGRRLGWRVGCRGARRLARRCRRRERSGWCRERRRAELWQQYAEQGRDDTVHASGERRRESSRGRDGQADRAVEWRGLADAFGGEGRDGRRDRGLGTGEVGRPTGIGASLGFLRGRSRPAPTWKCRRSVVITRSTRRVMTRPTREIIGRCGLPLRQRMISTRRTQALMRATAMHMITLAANQTTPSG